MQAWWAEEILNIKNIIFLWYCKFKYLLSTSKMCLYNTNRHIYLYISWYMVLMKNCCIWIWWAHVTHTHTHTSIEQLLSNAEGRKFHISSAEATLTVVLSSGQQRIRPISLKTTVLLLRVMEVCVRPALNHTIVPLHSHSPLKPLTSCVVWGSVGHQNSHE